MGLGVRWDSWMMQLGTYIKKGNRFSVDCNGSGGISKNVGIGRVSTRDNLP